MTMGADGSPGLHPQLAADCHVLGRIDGHTLLLQRNAALPWFVLVPPGSAGFVKRHHACDKINVAAIGNVVPQFHLHVVGRRRDDACWPLPVWGHLAPGGSWRDAELAALTAALHAAGCLDRD